MDILSITIDSRTELIKFVTPLLDDKSYKWFRDTINLINKSVIGSEDISVAVKVYHFYNNIKKFFTEYCTDFDAASVLLTMYICAIQIGVRFINDEVESFKQFTDGVDLNDWKSLCSNDINLFDLRMDLHIKHKHLSGEYQDIPACGLMTLQSIELL